MEWTAIYKDRTELKQFSEDGTEHMFGDIDHDNLLAFRVEGGQRYVVVDLSNGLFVLNGSVVEHLDVAYSEEPYKLVYFKRVAQNIGTSSNSVPSNNTFYYVGYQVTIGGVNFKKIYGIDNRGVIRPLVE
jgi:hypothetical protein